MTNGLKAESTKGDQELAFIRACLAYELFPERPVEITPADLDWERVYQLLNHHRLAPHFFVLGASRPGLWPAAFHERLRLDRYQLILYGDQCQERVRTIISALVEAGIQVIVLKGWALIQTIYGGDPGQRFCEDIDLLVKPQDVDAVERVFVEVGYQGLAETWSGYARCFMNARAYCLASQPWICNRLFNVGLHWGLLHTPAHDPKRIDINALFERSRPIQVVGSEVLELAVEDQIVYSCAHMGLHHKYDEALFRYFELAATIIKARATLDWVGILAQARNWRCLIPLYQELCKVDNLWPGVVPSWFLKAVAKEKPTLGERFVDLWLKKTKGSHTFAVLLNWLAVPGLLKRMQMVFQDIFPSPEYMRRRYGHAPGGFWPLLYFKRFLHAFQFFSKRLVPGD